MTQYLVISKVSIPVRGKKKIFKNIVRVKTIKRDLMYIPSLCYTSYFP